MRLIHHRFLFLLVLASVLLMGADQSLLGQDEAESDSPEVTEREYETPPLPPLDLDDEKLNQDLERYRENLDAREFSKALAIIKRVRSKVRKPEDSIAEIIDRYFREADGGTVFDKAKKYHDRKQYRKSLGIITKEDPKGDAFDGTRIGEELTELRELLIDEIFLLIDDLRKKGVGRRK